MSFDACNAIEFEYKHKILLPLLRDYFECPIIDEGMADEQESEQDFVYKMSERLCHLVRRKRPDWFKAGLLKPALVRIANDIFEAHMGEIKCQVARRLMQTREGSVLDWTGNGFTEISRRILAVEEPVIPSGLSVTRATFWYEAFPDRIYMLPTSIMRQFISRRDTGVCHATTFYRTAGDGNAAGVTWERCMFVRACQPLELVLTPGQQAWVLRAVEAKEEEARRSKARLV